MTRRMPWAHLVVLPLHDPALNLLRLRAPLRLEEQPHVMFFNDRLSPAALHDEPGLQPQLHLLEEEMYHPANFKDLHVLLIEEIQMPRTISRRTRAHLVV